MALEALAKAQARAPADEFDLWLHIGEAFLAMKSVADAEACRERAVQIRGVSVPVLCLDAHIHQVSIDNWVSRFMTSLGHDAVALEIF